MEFTFYYNEYEVSCICKKIWNRYHSIREVDDMSCSFFSYLDWREPTDDDRKQCIEKATEYIEWVWNAEQEVWVIDWALRDV